MDMELQQVKAMLRSVLLSSKEGVTSERFLSDYRAVTGELLPFKKFGFLSQNEFVASLPDVVHIQRSFRHQAYRQFTYWIHNRLGRHVRRVIPSCVVWKIRDEFPASDGVYIGFADADVNRFGEMVYHAVADDTTAHIQRLVSKQKSRKTKGPLRRTPVRHPTRPFRGRGGASYVRGRSSSSYFPSFAPYMRGRGSFPNNSYSSRGRGYAGRGRGFSSRGGMPVSTFHSGTPYVSTTSRETTPILTSSRETTPVSYIKPSVKEEVWESEDIENTDTSDVKATPYTHMQITFDVNSPPKKSSELSSNSSRRRVTDSNRMIFKALDAAMLQENKPNTQMKSYIARTYEVPPRFRKSEGNKDDGTLSLSTSPIMIQPSPSNVCDAYTEDDLEIQQRVVEILSGAQNGLWSTRVEWLYQEKYGNPPFSLIQRIMTWPHIARVEPGNPLPPQRLLFFDKQHFPIDRTADTTTFVEPVVEHWFEPVLNADRAIVHLVRDESERYSSVTPATRISSTVTSATAMSTQHKTTPRVTQVACPSTQLKTTPTLTQATPTPTLTQPTPTPTSTRLTPIPTSTKPMANPLLSVAAAPAVIWKDFEIPPPDLLELGDEVTVYVTFARHIDDFCIQREDCIVDFITDKLLIHCKSVKPPSTTVITTGVYAAALYNADDSWYRAQVLSDIHDEMVSVSFIDYGNVEEVRVGDIRPLSEEIAHIPAQAIPCALFGVKSNDIKSDDKTSPSLLAFAELVRDTALQATTIAHTIEGQCEVSLNVASNEVSINQQLIDNNLVSSTLATGVNILSCNGDVQQTLIHGEPDDLVLPDDKLWDVYISFLSPNLEVIMRLVGDMYSDKLEEFEEVMEECYQATGLDVPITDGMMCVANIENLYHRVRVFSVADGKAYVYFCDHGDKEILDSSQLRPLPPDLNRMLPYQAIQCRLFGFEMLEDSVSVLELLLEMALGQILVAEIISRDEELTVVLYDTVGEEDININQLIAIELSRKGEKINEDLLSTLSDCPSNENLILSNELSSDRDAEIASTDSFETAHSSVSAPSQSNEQNISLLSDDLPSVDSDSCSTRSVEDVLKDKRKKQSDIELRNATGDVSDVQDAETGDLSRNIAMVSLDDAQSEGQNNRLNEYTETELFCDPKSLVTSGACYRCNIVTDLTEISTRGIMLPSGDSVFSSKSLLYCKQCLNLEQTKADASTELDAILTSGDSGYSSKALHGYKYFSTDSKQSAESITKESKLSDKSEMKHLYTWNSSKSSVTGSGDNIPEGHMNASGDNIPENRVPLSGDKIPENRVPLSPDNIPENRVPLSRDNIPENRVPLFGDNIPENRVPLSGDNILENRVPSSVDNIPERCDATGVDHVLERGNVSGDILPESCHVRSVLERGNVSGDSVSESVLEGVATSNSEEVLQTNLPPKLDIPDPGHFMDVSVPFVLDPSNFVCVLYDMMESLQEFSSDLNKHFNNSAQLCPLPVENLFFEELYAGCFDGVWCRLILKDFLEDEASIYLPDLGQFNIMPSSEIFNLPRKFLQLPFSAIRASLHGIEPNGDGWSESTKFKFQELVQGRNFVALVMYKDDSNCAVLVKLIDTSGDRDVCIDELLVELNYAKFSKPPRE